MADYYRAIAVSVPDEEDDIALTAARFVCSRLESHLLKNGHAVEDWIKGGCDEDWGVYYESQRGDDRIAYSIGFFPGIENADNQMFVQYDLKIPFFKAIFRKAKILKSDDQMHETMRSFGKLFDNSRMLTSVEFENEY